VFAAAVQKMKEKRGLKYLEKYRQYLKIDINLAIRERVAAATREGGSGGFRLACIGGGQCRGMFGMNMD